MSRFSSSLCGLGVFAALLLSSSWRGPALDEMKTPSIGPCAGCTIDVAQVSSSTAVTIVVTSQAIMPGTCTGEEAPCTETPCKVKAVVKFTNTFARDIKLVDTTGACLTMAPGALFVLTILTPAGDPQPIICGQKFGIEVHLTNPDGSQGAKTGEVMWKCTACSPT